MILLRLVILAFAIIVILDFGWILTHWTVHPNLTRHAEYLGALAALLIAIDRVLARRRSLVKVERKRRQAQLTTM